MKNAREKDQKKRPTNQTQSARQRRRNIVIQSSGNLQVSGNKILIILRSKRIQVNFIVSRRRKSLFLVVKKARNLRLNFTKKINRTKYSKS